MEQWRHLADFHGQGNQQQNKEQSSSDIVGLYVAYASAKEK